MRPGRGVALALLLLPRLALAGPDEPDVRQPYLYRQALVGEFSSGQLYRIRVPRDVFDACPSFPADLRVFDAGPRAWPFFTWVPAGREEVQNLSAELMNRSEVTEPQRYVRQDLRVRPEPRGRGPARHDRLLIRMGGERYFRKVEVLGSDDRAVWAELGGGYLVGQGGDRGADNRVIEYPPSTYPFLQVRIHPDARNAAEPLDLQAISVARLAREEGEQEEVPLEWTQPAAEQKPGIQVVWADAGARHRPLLRLVVETAGRDFARPVKVFGRNAASNEWRWVADGGLHRMGDQVRDVIDLRGSAYRFWRIDFFHYDDQPLDLRRVRAWAVPHYLVFEAQGGAEVRPALYYGTDQFNLPRFDLQQRTSRAQLLEAPVREVGRRQLNPDRLARGLGRYGRALGILAVALVSVLVLMVIVNMIRRQTT